MVTSSISEKFLPGILIGYISELNNDANNLTKSGQLTPVVDFRHLQEVLVIRTLKVYVPSEETPEEKASGLEGWIDIELPGMETEPSSESASPSA